jgi:HD-GYP domain-containing protein (c-di-GMP phosphodiesterase class II)
MNPDGRAGTSSRADLPDKSIQTKIGQTSEAHFVFEQTVLLLGTQLVGQLHILMKTARVHERTNAAVTHSVDAFLTLLKTVAQDRSLTIRLQNDFLFLGETHLKISLAQSGLFMEFIDSLNARRVGAITFAPTVEAQGVRDFAYLFVHFDPTTATFADLGRRMAFLKIRGIDLEEATHLMVRPGETHKHARLLARNSYVKAAKAVGDVMTHLREGRPPSFKQAKRVLQSLVDLFTQDESVLMALTTLRCYDQYTHNHSVNVALLSISLGMRLSYSREALADLGLSALFHDVGKATIPQEILNKPAELTEEDWKKVQAHPSEGVLSLVKMRSIDRVSARMAAASFEHHMYLDCSGYPRLRALWRQTLTSRILSIADCYDAMTSSRVYRRKAMAPAAVLKAMMAKAGELFDPVLLKLFVNCVGILPVGCLVLLDTNELAVVTRAVVDGQAAERPRVKLITDAAGNPIDGVEVELEERNRDGRYVRSVVRLVDNAEHGFDTSRFCV